MFSSVIASVTLSLRFLKKRLGKSIPFSCKKTRTVFRRELLVFGALLGSIKREWLSSAFAKDKYEIFNQNNQLIGKIEETSAGSALARKYLPGGGLIPEKMTLELNGVPVAEINQSFKIIGDIWEMICKQIPQDFDRRVLLATMLLMGTIERDRK